MPIRVTAGGSTKATEKFLAAIQANDPYSGLERLAERGVQALAAATPQDSGVTANAWSYEIERKGDNVTIWWNNGNIQYGFNVAIGLQYGHGTGTGGWVEGYDYINPALQPVFDQIADEVWEEVRKL